MVSTNIRRAAAKRLRQNTTPHEQKLWRALKNMPLAGSHFRRQAPIGLYVVDFLSPAMRLVIEVDGSHHADAETASRDQARQKWLETEGYRVLRFWNSDITENLQGVLERIHLEFETSGVFADGRIRHHRRKKSQVSTPPRPLRGRPSPSRGG